MFKDGDAGQSEITGVLGSELLEERPTVRDELGPSPGCEDDAVRTASLSTRTSAETVFLIVDRPNSVSHWSIARSTRPAVIIRTGR